MILHPFSASTGSEMSRFFGRLGNMCASFYLSVSVDTLISHLKFDSIIVPNGWVDRSNFVLYMLLL